MKTVFSGYLSIIILLSGCFVLSDEPLQATRHAITIPSITPSLSPQPIVTIPATITVSASNLPNDVYDALPVSMGICFEAAWDAVGQVFIIRSAEEHIQFYSLADNANLCRRAVERVPFDFTGGDVLVGIWNRGIGCTAQHDIINYERDDTAQTISIQAQFSTDGDCNYELVRGLWLGIDNAQAYTINLQVTE